MNLKKIVAEATIAGTLGFAALGLGPGVAYASPPSADNVASVMWQQNGHGHGHGHWCWWWWCW